MLYKNIFLRGTVVLCGALILNGCGSKDVGQTPAANTPGGATATPPNASSVSDATPVPQRSFTGKAVKPPKGFGNAQGRVLWNEKPASGIKVRLCQDISMVTACGGKTFSATTDKDGNYTIDKVVPGDYSLAVQVFDTDMFIYPTSGIMTAAKYTIDEGKTLDIDATNLYKTDMQIVSPKAGETVKSGSPKLTWKAYPGATEYEVELSGADGGGASQSMKTSDTSVAPTTPLLNGNYEWRIDANNANGTKISETKGRTPFKVAGQAGSNSVDLLTPHPDAVIDGSKVVFTWKAHPLANGYQIYLAPQSGTALLSFEKLDGTGTSYPYSGTLPAGNYFWSITATKDGVHLAQSELKSFRVK